MEFPATPGRDGDVRAEAAQHLIEARDRQRELADSAEAAAGTSGEEQAAAALEKARHEVAAREAWAVWTERGM